MPTVAIVHGLAEGSRISRPLRTSLREHGYEITDDASQADIIVAHSAGGYLVPENTKAKAILLVGPSCGYMGKSLIAIQARKMHHDFRYARQNKIVGNWVRKSGHHVVYFVGRPRLLYTMWRNAVTHRTKLPTYPNKRVVVVTYRHDPWSGYLAPEEIQRNKNYSFISRSGVHDDIWFHPNSYITVLQYLYES